MGTLGLAFGRTGRIAAVNDIGVNLNVPKGGWPNAQAQLFERNDIRLSGVFALIARETPAKHIAANLAGAAHYSHANIMLTLVTVQREHSTAITASGGEEVHSFWGGGLDHLGRTKEHLGIPKEITKNWIPLKPFANPDYRHDLSTPPKYVYPASIPARDQVLAYAGQIGTSFDGFRRIVNKQLGRDGEVALSRLSKIGKLVWQAYAFLAPGGNLFEPTRSLRSQMHQGFGIVTALGYIVHTARASGPGGTVDLDQVLSDEALNQSAWVQSAKVRTIEALFLERLFAAVSQLTLVDQ